jgi:hypothetical protein
LDGGLPATLRHEICRELLQTIHEWRPRELFRANDEGITALLNLDFVTVKLELPRNSDSLTIPAHKEPCFFVAMKGALLQSYLYIRDDMRVCRMSQWIVRRSITSRRTGFTC